MVESAYYIPVPISTDSLPEEYRFLDKYFFGDNYRMVLSEDGQRWIWKGLNRYIREMELTRIK
ncbi:hypothetical protein [Olivibacter sitiensis]|uniref:hypothetical protein n=1 Tax=Olivibacter sitiensis TaxID=376470 RepID=UPI0004147624|nr:hypothetical protein [Olivibacter sitiensis]